MNKTDINLDKAVGNMNKINWKPLWKFLHHLFEFFAYIGCSGIIGMTIFLIFICIFILMITTGYFELVVTGIFGVLVFGGLFILLTISTIHNMKDKERN